MNLVIDVGNTLVKFAVFQDNILLEKLFFELELFEKKVQYFFRKYPEIKFSILCSVQKQSQKWKLLLKEKSIFLQLSSSTPVFFENKYSSKSTLGIDRLALVAAAAYQYKNENVLIIDAGTCITYDFKNNKNEYLGGIISPGLNMRAKAMHQFTAKLPLVKLENNDVGILGQDTQQCLEIGVLKATALEIDGFITEYKNKFEDLTVILTGGDSQTLSKNVKNSIFAPSNFLLEGLNQILEFNKS
ncbi:type III pantothenate kinase [Mesonia aestuariivivens]|uniref:Type III pantothenate kinase n=1 Tax=Mesonia aestuariivivens TaxID=2796128 RepID=A0ABS6VXW8_9FLAO|nr:type III pantothenate kinase [Mesonia aestuariivivens]MBW2960427.1 type III pantothenate kinase [Mesonia aestuariivivens]